jgi:hypothetical protein
VEEQTHHQPGEQQRFRRSPRQHVNRYGRRGCEQSCKDRLAERNQQGARRENQERKRDRSLVELGWPICTVGDERAQAAGGSELDRHHGDPERHSDEQQECQAAWCRDHAGAGGKR